MTEAEFCSAASAVASVYEGVELKTQREAEDCLSFFFTLPKEEGGSVEVELSIYDLGGGKIVLSLEPDAAENHHFWDEAAQLAEDLADELGGESVDL